jgi:hypothetical protein
MTDRLAELEAKAFALNAEIAKLKAGRPAQPPPPKDEGVRVLHLLDERTDLPNLAELKKLHSAVRNLVPETKSHDPDAGFRGFCGAYRFVSNCGRIAVPNAKVSLTWWCDVMVDWLRQRSAMTLDITGASFIAAVLASGDILYVPHDSNLGHVWEFGIAPPGHGGGKPASDAWKRVLEGSVLAPSRPSLRMAPPSPARVYGG